MIEILVAAGDEVAAEDPLVTLESDKATMDVPAPVAGTVGSCGVKIGDRVSEGSVLLTLRRRRRRAPAAPRRQPPRSRETRAATGGAALAARGRAAAAPQPPPPATGERDDFQVVVIGAGPGGYTAAFRAADLGLKTVAHRALRDGSAASA